MRKLFAGIRLLVLISVAAHAALMGGLMFVTGIVGPGPDREQTMIVKAQPDAPQEPDEPPPPPEERLPEIDPPYVEPVLPDDPVPEPEIFERDPDSGPDSLLPPDDLPWSTTPRIGIGGGNIGGGGARGGKAAPPPEPEPVKNLPKVERKPAAAKEKPAPSYPRRARERGLQGSVVLLVEVLPDGTVGEVRLTQSSGHALLDRAAERAVRRWVFEPARVNGVPVRSLVECPFLFELEDEK